MIRRWILAAALTAASTLAAADQMVIDGNAVRDGDSVTTLLRYYGQPLTKSYKSGCLNSRCSTIGTLERWVYWDDGIEYTVFIYGDTIRAIEWKHSR